MSEVEPSLIRQLAEIGRFFMTKKLWQKNWKLDTLIESFETKDDLIMDQKLVPYDVYGSIAHAAMLHKIGILTEKEFSFVKEDPEFIATLKKITENKEKPKTETPPKK